MESDVELNKLLLRLVLLCHMDIQETLSWWQCKIQLFRDKLGQQKVLESAFFELSESLQFFLQVTFFHKYHVDLCYILK